MLFSGQLFIINCEHTVLEHEVSAFFALSSLLLVWDIYFPAKANMSDSCLPLRGGPLHQSFHCLIAQLCWIFRRFYVGSSLSARFISSCTDCVLFVLFQSGSWFCRGGGYNKLRIDDPVRLSTEKSGAMMFG